MKRLICFMLFCVSIPCYAYSPINKEYDKFKGRTYETVNLVSEKRASISAYFSYLGDKPSEKIETVFFNIYSINNGWKLLEDHQLYFLVNNGEYRYIHDDSKWIKDNKVLSGSLVREDLTALIPVNDFTKIANATTLEMKIASESGMWNSLMIEKIKYLSDRIAEINKSLESGDTEPKEKILK